MNFSLKATKTDSDELISIYTKDNPNFDVFYSINPEDISINVQHSELINTIRENDLETFAREINKITKTGEKINIELFLNNNSVVKFKVKTFIYSVDYDCKVAILDNGKITSRKMAGVNNDSLLSGWNETCTFYKDLNN